METYVGIDLSVSRTKHIPIVFVRRIGGRIVPFEMTGLPPAPKGPGNTGLLDENVVSSFADEIRNFICTVCAQRSLTILGIAIDAPMSARPAEEELRACERALGERGISYFKTPTEAELDAAVAAGKRHLRGGGEASRLPRANQLWMLAGFALFAALEEVAPIIEVYPQAIVDVLGWKGQHKTHKNAALEQLALASRFTGWPDGPCVERDLRKICRASAHDAVDAYLAAWVASLSAPHREALGEPPGDAIWIPAIGRMRAMFDGFVHPTSHGPLDGPDTEDSGRTGSQSNNCPLCGASFKRFPSGWDGHVHRCPALLATTIEERKSEYRRRAL